MFLVNSYQFGGGVVASLLLDLYPATAAYSLRKLRTAYSGSAIRVRRSSDNAEQDIGFSGNDLDTASLLSFVGANNGFVVTWYDQQGANNLTQGSSTSQPQIVSSGSLITRGGKVAVKFDGSNDRLLRIIASAVLNTTNVSHFSVSNNDVNLGFGIIMAQSTSSTGTVRIFNDRRITDKINMRINNTLNVLFTANMSIFRNSVDQRLLSSFVDSLKNMSAFDNGATGTTDTYTGTTTSNGLQMGAQGSGVTWLNGTIQEFIGFNTDESANRTAIETNINNYYGIY
jgi:hypothetical protein